MKKDRVLIPVLFGKRPKQPAAKSERQRQAASFLARKFRKYTNDAVARISGDGWLDEFVKLRTKQRPNKDAAARVAKELGIDETKLRIWKNLDGRRACEWAGAYDAGTVGQKNHGNLIADYLGGMVEIECSFILSDEDRRIHGI